VIRQAVIAKGSPTMSQDAFERKLLAIRKETQNPLAEVAKKKNLPGLAEFYMPSLSTRTIVYKGLLLASQVGTFYKDLTSPLCESALALVHQRFSTNTFPSVEAGASRIASSRTMARSTPLRGNVNWMYARQAFDGARRCWATDLEQDVALIPYDGQSDTACLDNALELLVMPADTRLVACAMMMLIPEAWAGHQEHGCRSASAFYEYHAAHDGAVGWPGRHRLHRWPPDWRNAGSQRPSPRALSS
jgi:glutamate synthase (NADPH/NADH) large chain